MMARTVQRWALAVVFAALFCTTSGYARFDVWQPENGVQVRQGRHVSWVHNSTVPDGNGNFLTAWSDASTGSMDVYAQLFALDGTPVWSNPLTIANNSHPEQEAKIVRTSDDAWIIAWLDYGEDLMKSGVGRLYLRKLNDQGADLWPAPVGPIEESSNGYNSGNSYEGFYLFPNSDGGVIIGSDLVYETWVQRVTGDGTIAWADAVHPLPRLINRPRCIPDGADGLIMLGHEYIDQDSDHVVGQRITPDGELLWGSEGEPISFVQDVPSSNWHIRTSGSGDWLLVWTATGHQVVMQKFDADANPLWGDSPVPVQNQGEGGYIYRVYPLEGAQVLLNWEYQQVHSIQRMDFSGDEPLYYFDSPVSLDFEVSIQYAGQISPFIVLLKTQQYTATGIDFTLRAFGAAGEEVWNSEFLPYSDSFVYSGWYGGDLTFLPDEESFTMLSNGTLEENSGLMLHRFSVADGSLLLDQPLELATGLASDTRSPQLINTGETLFTYWMDERLGESHYFQILDLETGAPQCEPGGRDFFPATAGMVPEGIRIESPLKVAPTATGGLLAARLEAYDNWYDAQVRVQRVSNRGEILWGLGGKVVRDLSSNDNGIANFEFAVLPDGSSFLVFNSFNDVFWMELRLLKLRPDGTPAWNEPNTTLLEGYDQERDYLIKLVQPLPNGETLLIVDGMDFFEASDQIHHFRLDSEGEVVSHYMVEYLNSNMGEARYLPQEDGSLVVLHPDSDWNLVLDHISAEGEFITAEEGVTLASFYHVINITRALALFEDGFGILTSPEDVYRYHRFNFAGEPLLEPEGVELPAGIHFRHLLSDGEEGVWALGWLDNANASDLGYIHIDSMGQPTRAEYEAGPVTLCDAWFDQIPSTPIPDGAGGFISVWNDYRGSLNRHEYDDVYAMRVNDFITGVGDSPAASQPGEFALLPAYPNPFNPSTTLTYTIPRDGKVRLAIYDLLGREVVRLVDGVQGAGVHRQVWNATSRSGVQLASGTYFVRYDTPQGVQAQKILLLK